MEKLKELSSYSFPDTLEVPDGYDLKTIPDITRDNFQLLIDEHNELVSAVNTLFGHVIHDDL